jgi:SecD/SecF fusion protein
MPFGMEIDQHFIAAILTVIGYSMNDTVIVFDRVREYLGGKSAKGDFNSIVNQSINSTMSRTINTSLTMILVLLIMFIFGGESIRGFIFAMLVGIVVGTYSSLFIATPVLCDTISEEEHKRIEKEHNA